MASLMVAIGLLSLVFDPRKRTTHLPHWRRLRVPRLSAAAEARLLREVAADLRAGVHPTAAFIAAADANELDVRSSARQTIAGAGTKVVTYEIAQQLPVNRDILGAAAGIAIETGAGLAAVLYRLADRADAVAAEHREQTVATAQARLSAAVVAGLPLIGIMAMAVTGGFGDLEGLSLELVAVAMSLVIAGVATTAWMVRG